MIERYYDVEPTEAGWVIRRNALDAAHCADRESALRIAFALAKGELQRSGQAGIVRLHEHDSEHHEALERSA